MKRTSYKVLSVRFCVAAAVFGGFAQKKWFKDHPKYYSMPQAES